MDLHLKPNTAGDPIQYVQLEPHHVIQPKRNRIVTTPESFIDFLNKWGDDEKASIYAGNDSLVAVLDEENDYDRLTLKMDHSLVTKRWLRALGQNFTQDTLRTFLEIEENRDKLQGGDHMFALMSQLSIAVSMTFDKKIDDDNNYQIAFKNDVQGDVAKIPKKDTLTLDFFKGAEVEVELPLRLKFTAPKNADDKPTFCYVCDTLQENEDWAMEKLVEAIKGQLPDFLFVTGNP